MIRRMAGRVRRAIAARLMPLRDRSRDRITELSRRGSTALVIPREIARALASRIARGLRDDSHPLRVGVDIRPFYEPLTGVGWYLYYLLEELARQPEVELVLFGDPLITDEGPHLHVSLPASVRTVGFDFRGRPISRVSRWLASAGYLMLTVIEGCDLFFAANFFLPRAVSAVARRRVITIHDLTYRIHPELVQDETLANLEREMLREISRADAIICVSESTRQDVLSEYIVDPAKVVTIHSGAPHPAPEPALRSAARDERASHSSPAEPVEGLPQRFILFVSTIEPRKNLDLLLDAFERLREEKRYSGDLVVVGKVGWKTTATLERIQGGRWRQAIHHLDYLSRDQLAGVYERADVFVLPSIYEGFGFPMLEAMAHGVPVVAARSSSLPEVGGDAALYFDPHSANELADAIVTVTNDPDVRQSLVEKGRLRVAAFPWRDAAARTLEVFHRVAEA